LPNIITIIKPQRIRRNVARVEKRNAHRIFVGKSEGNRPLGSIDIGERINYNGSWKDRMRWYRLD
jgi:hypothetical protein